MARYGLLIAVFLMLSVRLAHGQDDWVLRAGLSTMSPEASSDVLPAPVSDELDVDADTQVGFSLTRMVDDAIGVEFSIATPYSLAFYGGPGEIPVGSLKLLSTALTLQYYFPFSGEAVRSYIAGGMHYAVFYEDRLSRAAKYSYSVSDMEFDDVADFLWAIGCDIEIDEDLYLNLAMSRVAIDSKASITDASGVEVLAFDVALDPWLYNIGIAWRF